MPWIWIIIGGVGLLTIIGLIIFMAMKPKASAVQVPPALIGYIKSAKEKKVTEQAIRDALLKSGWKPEQINAGFKKAK